MAVLTDIIAQHKEPVVAASTVNVPLNSRYPIIDGVQTVQNDRILLKDQTNKVQNNIYKVTSTGLVFTTDVINSKSADDGMQVSVLNGTVNANKTFFIHPIPAASYAAAEKNWIISPFTGNNSSDSIISVTYAQLYNMYNNSTLVAKQQYMITDYTENSVNTPLYVTAESTNKLKADGLGEFKNADYNGLGHYDVSAVNSLAGISNFSATSRGVWASAAESTYANGQVVIYNNINYVIKNSSAFSGTSPNLNSSAYFALNANTANMGYVTTVDKIKYEIAFVAPDSSIIGKVNYRADKYNNAINNYVAGVFQFGNKNFYNNNVFAGSFNCINSRAASINNVNIFNSSSLTASNTTVGNISNINIFGGDNDITLEGLGDFVNITVNMNTNKATPFVAKFTTKLVNGVNVLSGLIMNGHSDFVDIVNASGSSTFDFTAGRNHIGTIGLTSTANDPLTIDSFANFPVNFPVTFYAIENVVTFVHGDGKIYMRGGSDFRITSGAFATFVKRESYPGSGIFNIYQTAGESYEALGLGGGALEPQPSQPTP